MKRNTRHRLLFFALGVLVVGAALAVAAGFGAIQFPGMDVSGSPGRTAETGEARSSGQGSRDQASQGGEQSSFRYQTGSPDTAGPRPTQDGRSFSRNELDNIGVYERRNEAVVNITTETVSYNWFLEPVPREGGSGSGTIIDKRGYVLTNNHVVREAAKVYVTLADGDRLEAEVVGTDPENDLAVIKFDPGGRDLVTIPMGTSSNLEVGQKVLAIGNPFGLDRTLTTGIVSALGRPIRTYNDLVIRNMIQTDASINPGNSGGPLLDTDGNLIGINTVILSPSGTSVGIGFAVPAETARRVVPDLIQYGQVRRGWIEIVPRQLFPELVQYANLSVSEGVLVSEVIPGGNAADAGLRGGDKQKAVRYGNTVIYLGGDIILEVDGTRVRTLANLYEALEDSKPGETVTVRYLRNGRERTTEVTLAQRPEKFRWD